MSRNGHRRRRGQGGSEGRLNGEAFLSVRPPVAQSLAPVLASPGDATPRPQAMLFTLWGDYVVHRGGEIWTGSLIRIAAEFGLSELALRSVLSRMVRSGWLEATRHGNRSYYRLTRRGQALIQEGTARIFQRRRRQPWDGAWRLVSYSVPETERDLRDQLRKRLLYLGFGSLSAGTWITPHDLRAEVAQLAAGLGMADYVDQFCASLLPPGDSRALAARVWPLDHLAAAYRSFIDRWQQVAETARAVPDARAFVLRFWLIHEFQRFFLEDPGLPAELVPAEWPGERAADLFDTLHDLLAPAAIRFFDAVFEARQLQRA